MPNDRSTGLGLGAAAVAGATLAVYLRIIFSQGESNWTRVAAIAALMSAGAIAAAVATRLVGVPRTVTLAVAGAHLLVLGLVGIFSVGLPLLVASGLALAAAARSAAGARRGGAFVVGVVAGSFPVVVAVVFGALVLTP